jgi:hypothetical protein
MALIPVGAATMTATLDRVTVGWFSGDLVNGQLLLKVTTTSTANISGLAFGVVSLIESDTNTRVLGDARYYPKPEPSVIALGYGDRATVTGEVVIEPRAYNLRWLLREDSPSFWRVLVEAETPSGVSVPTYTPAGYATTEVQLTANAVSGADGKTYGRIDWYE